MVTMSRAGAIMRLVLVTLLSFGGQVLVLVQARPDNSLRWWDWLACAMTGLGSAYTFVNKAWAASSSDPPPAIPATAYFAGVSPGLSPTAPNAPAPVSGHPGAAQGYPAPTPAAPFDPNKTIIPGSADPTGEM